MSDRVPVGKINREKTPEQALRSLCMTCSRMERCVSDARRSLARWNIPPEEQQKIIARLVAEKFIDERRYADAYVREKVSAGRWGLGKIIFGLRSKQIPEDIIRCAVAEHADADVINGKLEEELSRRIGKEKGKAKDGYDLRARLFRFAASRGYGYEEINGLLDKLLRQ